MTASPVVEFYTGRQPDDLGRTLAQILAWDDGELESRHNNNYLRIIRTLKCLGALGLVDRASAFLFCHEDVYREFGGAIGPETLRFWRQAVA